MKTKTKRLLALALALIMCASLLPGFALAAEEYSVTLEASAETVSANDEFTVSVILNGTANADAPAAASVKLNFTGVTFVSGSTSMSNGRATSSASECVASYYNNTTAKFDADGKLTIATFTFNAGASDATFTVTEAVATEPGSVKETTVVPPSEWLIVKMQSNTGSLNIVTIGNGKVSYYGQSKFEDSNGGYLYYWAEPDEGNYVSSVTLTVNGTNMSPRAGTGCGGYFRLDDLSLATELTVTFSQFVSTVSIGTATELADFRDEVNNGTSCEGVLVKLTADIDMSNVGDWTPIGTSSNPFSGTLDGNGHVVSGLNIVSSGSYTGFLGRTNGAQILNLTVSGEAKSASSNMGGIVASPRYTRIGNCRNYVDLDGSDTDSNIGGIAGDATFCVISDCANYGTVSGQGEGGKGGILGRTVSGYYNEITRCVNEGDVTGVDVGGICGNARNIVINQCANKGNIYGVSTAGSSAAGIMAAASGELYPVSIISCYNTGSVTGSTTNTKRFSEPVVGGIFGIAQYSANIDNCWNTGTLAKTGLFTSTETRYGEIAPLKDIHSTGTHGGGEVIDVIDVTNVTITDCYTSADEITSGKLNATHEGVWTTDDNDSIILWWEDTTTSEIPCKVTFSIMPANVEISISVYSDEAMSDSSLLQPGAEGYVLSGGTYYYKIAAEGYVTESGTFKINGADITVSKTLREASIITFSVAPLNAELSIATANGTKVNEESHNGSNYVFSLYKGDTYTYTATADGYNSTTREFTVTGDATMDVTLTASSQGQVEESRVIKPDNVPYTITEGGSYDLEAGDFASGYVYINTTEPVTIIGSGVASSSISEDLHIVCQTSGVNLTLQDVYISNTDGKANMINFQGADNTLAFAGTSILDQDSNAAGWAMIHVPDSAELTVTGGTVYLYKREQGAGIGGNGGAGGGEGQSAETNGTINIVDATIYGKNSKQGALIGAGAQAGSQRPGDITIEDSTLYLIAISRGGAIGGSAGSGGASSGTNVTVSNSQITINVDWSGSAIGGGGYDGGNDSDGGTLIYESGSVRTFIDVNALGSWNVTEAGVNGNKAITASIENSSGTPLYLLMFNTESVGGSSFTVKDGNKTIYSGGLHEYAYINEALHKDNQIPINYTIDNWTSLDDPNLYLYLTGEDHTLDVNGKTFTATWKADTQTFEVKDSSGGTVTPGGGGGGGIAAPTKTDSTVASDTAVSGDTATVTVKDSDLEKAAEGANKNTQLVVSADVPKDADVDTVTTTLPADGMKATADSGASLKVETPVGDVVLSNAALKDLTKDGGDIKITVTENDDGTTSVTISEGGTEVKNIAGGVKVAIPARDGQVAVLVKEDGTREIIQKSVVENGQAYVLLDGSAKIEIVDNNKSFEDVPDNAWFKSAVDFVSSHELFRGISETEFGPGLNMTRAMMATVLYRLEGEIGVTGTSGFDDVKSGEWYSDAVKWANDAGIVLGYDEKTFGTNDNITREQMAVMFYRYAKYAGMDTTASKSLSSFPDGNDVSSWAQEAMSWCAAVGLFKGDDTGALNPTNNATRAEVATLFQRMVELMVK